MQDANGGQRSDLDEQILERVRHGPRTRDELVTEVGEAERRIHSRLQFLDGAGYVEQNEETGGYELRDDPEEPDVFEERPRLRWVAFGAVFLLSGALYFHLLDVVYESAFDVTVLPIVALVFALPFAWVTARTIVSPRLIGEGQAYRIFNMWW